MGIVHYPGEIKNFKMKAAEGLDREGLILKVDNSTASDPRMTKVASSGDGIFGIGAKDTDDQEGTNATGGMVGVLQEGEVKVAVEADTYRVGYVISLATTNGMGEYYVKNTSFSNTVVGICQEYRVVSSDDVTNKVNQIRVKLQCDTGLEDSELGAK